MPYKTYVGVNAFFDREGSMIPKQIIWNDNRVFEIDRVVDVRRRASTKIGGTGYRYTIMVHGMIKYLYFEDPKWFVEAK